MPTGVAPTLAPLVVEVQQRSAHRPKGVDRRPMHGHPLAPGPFLCRCFDVVVDADRGQQSVRAAFVDPDSRLRLQVVTAPVDAVVFQGAAHAVVGHGAVLEPDAAACAEALVKKERSALAPRWVACGPTPRHRRSPETTASRPQRSLPAGQIHRSLSTASPALRQHRRPSDAPMKAPRQRRSAQPAAAPTRWSRRKRTVIDQALAAASGTCRATSPLAKECSVPGQVWTATSVPVAFRAATKRS
jgi:hypothetical protein